MGCCSSAEGTKDDQREIRRQSNRVQQPTGKQTKKNSLGRRKSQGEGGARVAPEPAFQQSGGSGITSHSTGGVSGSSQGKRLGGGAAEGGDLREKVAQAALARADGKPKGITQETADKLKDRHERDELVGRINALAARLHEEVPLAIRAKDTPLSKLRSYKTYLEQKISEKGQGQ